MNHTCTKESTISEIISSISNMKSKIAVLINQDNNTKESIKNIQEDMKKIDKSVNDLLKSIDDRFTDLDRQKIEDLKHRNTTNIALVISIVSGIAVPIIIFLLSKGGI